MYYNKIKKLDINDIENMSASQLRDVVSSGKQALMERQEQFTKTKTYSPAFEKFDPKALRTSGRKSSLQAQAKLVVEKLNDQTTTRAGYREWKRNVKEAMGLTGKRISEKKMRDIWEAFDKFKEKNPNVENIIGSADAVKMMSEVTYGSVDDMISQLENIAREWVQTEYDDELDDEQFYILMGRE